MRDRAQYMMFVRRGLQRGYVNNGLIHVIVVWLHEQTSTKYATQRA